MKKRMILAFASVFLFYCIVSVYSYYGPRAVLMENVTGTYGVNSDYASSGAFGSFSSIGYIKVFVPNTDDVLQYVRLNLSDDADDNTNIENWNDSLTAYRDYAQSYPTLASGTSMYVNTSTSNMVDQYTPDFNWAPSLNLSMTVTNTRAGDDLYSEDDIINSINILQFNFTIINPASIKNLTGTNVTYNITFNTAGSNSSVGIIASTISATSGTAWARDRDSDSTWDAIEWQDTLSAGTQVDIIFNATALGGENYASTSNNLNEGAYGANALYLNTTHVLSEITFTGRFARGPVRHGLEMVKGTPWRVKTYIKNMGQEDVSGGQHNLTYNISAWRMYNVTSYTGEVDQLLSSNVDLNYVLSANTQYMIPAWIETTSSKPYIAPYFDWYVLWNDTDYYTYSGKINFSMTLPTLYEIDNNPTKETSDTFAPDVYGVKLLSYNVSAQHVGSGDSQIRVGKLQIYSVIPNKNIGGSGYANMTINESTSTYHVYYTNSTSTYELTQDSNVQVTITQSTSTSNGSIVLDISDLSTAEISSVPVGQNLTNGDYITLLYEIWAHENSAGSKTSGIDNGEHFHFDGNQTLYTQSGTYLVESNSEIKTASQNSLTAYKQLISTGTTTPQLVNVTINLSVVGSIENIKFIDYIPTGMSNHTQVIMTSDIMSSVYNRTNIGTITTGDGMSMDAWEITNLTANDGWDMTTGYIAFTYQLNLSTPGLYVLPVQIAAFDPGADTGISLTRYGSIKYIIPEKMLPLVIDEDDTLQLLKTVTVGKPGVWSKSFNIYNPNSKPVKSIFRAEVFKDTVESYASYYGDYGSKIEENVDTDVTGDKKYIFWETTIQPQESRSYELRILTPPIVEVDRDVEVLEKLEDKHVKLKADIVLKNFAEEPYSNIKLNLNIPKDNIFELKDGFGNSLSYTGDASSTTVTIPDLDANTVMSLSLTYKQSYPTVIITPDRSRYDSGEIANLEILIINGGEKIESPAIETEILTEDMELVYADIMRLEESLEPLEKTELSTKFLLPLNAPTGKYMANVRFSEDLVTITESSINFYVLGMKGDASSNIKVLVIVLLGAILIYFAYKRLVRVSKK